MWHFLTKVSYDLSYVIKYLLLHSEGSFVAVNKCQTSDNAAAKKSSRHVLHPPPLQGPLQQIVGIIK